jgi:carbon monoxide dehydrogenase subunit G
MKLTLASVIPADQDQVFAALVDPEILQRVIPGCDALTETGPDQYTATLKIGAAGLKGTYTGKAAVRDRVPPDSLSLHFEGKGAPGFVRGAAAIALTADRGLRDRRPGGGRRVAADRGDGEEAQRGVFRPARA